MKFYDFNEYDYGAIIWAKNEKEACEKYEEEVCDILDEKLKLKPSVIDVDEVLEMMLKCSYEDDKDIKSFGVAYELFRIIKSNDSLVVVMDSSLN